MPNLISAKRYTNLYDVTVICPKCGNIRYETWKLKPDMKNPRVACVNCKSLFKQDEDCDSVKGLSLRCNQAQKSKRSNA